MKIKGLGEATIIGRSVLGGAKKLKCDVCKKKTDCVNYKGGKQICNDCWGKKNV